MDEVSQNLTPGKVAVVADADEEWVTPLDTRMEALGGIVFRRARGEFMTPRSSANSRPIAPNSPS